MAKTLPLEIKVLAQMGKLTEDKFYVGLLKHTDYVDPEQLKNIYRGLVEHIAEKLREDGGIRLPGLGDMVLVKQKPHLNLARIGAIQQVPPDTMVLKFYPKEAFKDRFKGKNTPIPFIPSTTLDEYRVEE